MKNVKILHLEPTSRCNAACPQCARFLSDGITIDPRLIIKDLSLDQIKQKLSVDFISNLDKMFMCGDFGDPAASLYSIEILKYFRSLNANITLGMNTNGSLRGRKFWSELGQILSNPTDYCVFSIDGLIDTNHLYRRNTKWNKIIQNVETFIAAGGKAQWDMLVFQHNEHQIEQASKLAEQMGFVSFRSKSSKRHSSRPIVGIAPASNAVVKPITSEVINCQAVAEKSVYMDHTGEIWPCCWIGADKFYQDPITLAEVLINPLPACFRNCGVSHGVTNYTRQWTSEVYFK